MRFSGDFEQKRITTTSDFIKRGKNNYKLYRKLKNFKLTRDKNTVCKNGGTAKRCVNLYVLFSGGFAILQLLGDESSEYHSVWQKVRFHFWWTTLTKNRTQSFIFLAILISEMFRWRGRYSRWLLSSAVGVQMVTWSSPKRACISPVGAVGGLSEFDRYRQMKLKRGKVVKKGPEKEILKVQRKHP